MLLRKSKPDDECWTVSTTKSAYAPVDGSVMVPMPLLGARRRLRCRVLRGGAHSIDRFIRRHVKQVHCVNCYLSERRSRNSASEM